MTTNETGANVAAFMMFLLGNDISELNAWMRLGHSENPEWRPDLRGANLKGRIIQGAILTHARLDGADLSGTNLNGADLTCASLRGAILENAIMSETILHAADLTGAKASGIHLQEADMQRATLTDADLTGADLTNAKIDQTPAEWMTVKGLETIKGLPHGLRADAFSCALMTALKMFTGTSNRPAEADEATD